MIGYVRMPVVTATPVDDDLFVVAPDSQEIYHLDSMAAAIWHALAEPTAREALLETFGAAFPEVEPARLAADVDAALGRLLDGGLVRAVDLQP